MLAAKASDVGMCRLLIEAFNRSILMTNVRRHGALSFSAMRSSLGPQYQSSFQVPLTPPIRTLANVNSPERQCDPALSQRFRLTQGVAHPTLRRNPLTKKHYSKTPSYSPVVATELHLESFVAEFERRKVNVADPIPLIARVDLPYSIFANSLKMPKFSSPVKQVAVNSKDPSMLSTLSLSLSGGGRS